MDETNYGISMQWNITQPQKRNTLLILMLMWMNLKSITLSERSQNKKSMYWITSFIDHFRKCKLIYSDRKKISDFIVTWGWRGRKERLLRGTRKLLGLTEMPALLITVSQLYTYFETDQIVYFTYVCFSILKS